MKSTDWDEPLKLELLLEQVYGGGLGNKLATSKNRHLLKFMKRALDIDLPLRTMTSKTAGLQRVYQNRHKIKKDLENVWGDRPFDAINPYGFTRTVLPKGAKDIYDLEMISQGEYNRLKLMCESKDVGDLIIAHEIINQYRDKLMIQISKFRNKIIKANGRKV